jgi:hypothetical protein
LGSTPFGWNNLPLLIVDVLVPLAAALSTVLAYRRYMSGASHFRAMGWWPSLRHLLRQQFLCLSQDG